MKSTYDLARTLNGGRETGDILTNGKGTYWRYSDRASIGCPGRPVFGWQLRADGSNGAYMQLPAKGLKVHRS